MTILEAEGLRNVAVLKKTDSYVAAELIATSGTRESRTSVAKVNVPVPPRGCHVEMSQPGRRPLGSLSSDSAPTAGSQVDLAPTSRCTASPPTPLPSDC